MNHPLTDDIIESDLATPAHFTSGSLVGLFTHDDMRLAYDKGRNDQLEKVIRYLENDLEFVLWSDSFMDKFKKAIL